MSTSGDSAANEQRCPACGADRWKIAGPTATGMCECEVCGRVFSSRVASDAANVSQVFVQHCRICGRPIETVFGPDFHFESAEAIRQHVLSHAQYELVDYAIKEALRGTSPH